jgi:5-(aminomethyl)-3-furanmethanol phosphate kinase
MVHSPRLAAGKSIAAAIVQPDVSSIGANRDGMPMRHPDAVLKLGGSLSRRPTALRRLMEALGGLARTRTLVVVPGGGRFADQVRRADRSLGLSDSAAHWMAILAMDQYAHLLVDLAPAAALVRGRGEIGAGRVNVLAPSAWLRRADPLPHSWQVTSDSIAAWVARRLDAKGLILLKDVDGFFDRNPREVGQARLRCRVARGRLQGVVDGYFTRALGRRMPCWILNGGHPERVVGLVQNGEAHGTQVV